MKKIISKAFAMVAIAATLFSFTTNFGGEGFEISLSPGLTGLSPVIPPENCLESFDGGNWVWVPGTITSSNTGLQAGPGWFYETSFGGPVDVYTQLLPMILK